MEKQNNQGKLLVGRFVRRTSFFSKSVRFKQILFKAGFAVALIIN
jgi:hypothetical protein